jgi:predicted RNA-binding protein YlqC (UPF0109 family)
MASVASSAAAFVWRKYVAHIGQGWCKRQVKELIEYMSRSLVDEPDQVRITQVQGAQSAIFELSVAPGDAGKIIGRQGRIINAMRILVRVAAAKEGKHAVLEVV